MAVSCDRLTCRAQFRRAGSRVHLDEELFALFPSPKILPAIRHACHICAPRALLELLSPAHSVVFLCDSISSGLIPRRFGTTRELTRTNWCDLARRECRNPLDDGIDRYFGMQNRIRGLRIAVDLVLRQNAIFAGPFGVLEHGRLRLCPAVLHYQERNQLEIIDAGRRPSGDT